MAEMNSVNELGHSACCCLRSKEMFIHSEPDDRIQSMSSGIFWCLHTHTCLGPDGQTAEPENCRPGRSCYDAL